MKTRLKRGAIGALVALLVFGAGAFADTQSNSPTVTVAVATGSRHLSVTGGAIDGSTNLPSGPASLSFNGASPAPAPFGVIVTDVAHSNVGYEVDATLTNLYRLNPDAVAGDASDRFVCGDRIDSSAFAVGFATTAFQLTDQVEALVRPNLVFVDDVADNLGVSTSSLTDLTVDVADWVAEVPTSLLLMDVIDGGGGTFDNRATHPCDSVAGLSPPSTVDEIELQDGTPESGLDLTTLAGNLYDTANASTSEALTPAEAITGDLLAPDSDVAGGALYEATKAELQTILNDLGLTVLDLSFADLDALTADVLDDVVAQADPVLDLLGQTGVYANVPQLTLDPGATAGKTTGLYQGTMTVTLTDK